MTDTFANEKPIVGVVLDTERPSRWIAELLERLDEMSNLVWAVTYIEPRPSSTRTTTFPLSVRILQWLDLRSDSKRHANVLARQNIEPLLRNRATVHLQRSGAWPSAESPVERGVDVLLDLRETGATPWPSSDSFETWSLRVTGIVRGDKVPPLFWNIAANRRLCEVRLIQKRSAGERLARVSMVSLAPCAISLSQRTVFRRATELIARELRAVEAGLPSDPSRDPARVDGVPEVGLSGMSRNATTACARIAASRLKRAIQNRVRPPKYRWMLGIRPRLEAQLGSSQGYAPLIPPAGLSWADPFLVAEGDRTFVFYERWGAPDRSHGVIEVMEIGAAGAPSPPRVVLERDYHLSYPFVFRDNSEWFMIPESGANGTIELYRAAKFPYKWELDQVLIDGVNAQDATVLVRDGVWWLFTTINGAGGGDRDELSIFMSDDLRGKWKPHPLNPVVSDVRHARPAGPIFEYEGRLIRPSQDCSERYGGAIVFREIETLSRSEYSERTAAVQRPDWLPNLIGCHHYSHTAGWEMTDGCGTVPKIEARDRILEG